MRMRLPERDYIAQISSMLDKAEDTIKLEEDMKVFEAEWKESDEHAEFETATGAGTSPAWSLGTQ